MERTRSHLDELGVLAAMATAPLIANALLTANALSAEPERKRTRECQPSADVLEGGSDELRRGWLDRLDDWLWKHEQRELEARLAAATDIFDLEVRIRAIERGSPWRPH